MTLITEDLWRERLGDMPMPEEATPEMMWAAIEAIESINETEDTLQNIALYQELKEIWISRHNGTVNSEVTKWYDDIIDFYRGKLNG